MNHIHDIDKLILKYKLAVIEFLREYFSRSMAVMTDVAHLLLDF